MKRGYTATLMYLILLNCILKMVKMVTFSVFYNFFFNEKRPLDSFLQAGSRMIGLLGCKHRLFLTGKKG